MTYDQYMAQAKALHIRDHMDRPIEGSSLATVRVLHQTHLLDGCEHVTTVAERPPPGEDLSHLNSPYWRGRQKSGGKAKPGNKSAIRNPKSNDLQ